MKAIEMGEDLCRMVDDLSKFNICRHDEGMPLYKYVSIETAKLIIGNGTIKFSTPKELDDNDLDLLLLDTSIDEEISRKMMAQILMKYLPAEIAHFYLKLQLLNPAVGIPCDEVELMLKSGYDNERMNFGIFCLTTNTNSEHMWTRYADNHKGVCLEFKFPRLFTNIYYTFTVAYSKIESRKLFNDDGTINSLSVNRWLFTKDQHYSIEKEVRMITETSIGLYRFPKHYLTNMIYGNRTSDLDKSILEELLKNCWYCFN